MTAERRWDTPHRPGTTGPAASSREPLAASQKAHTGDHVHYFSQGQAGREHQGRVVPCSQLTASPTSLQARAPEHTKGHRSKPWRQLQRKHRQACRAGTAALAVLLERESCVLVSIRKTVECSAPDPPVKCQSRDWHQERGHPDILHSAGSKKANGKQHVMSRRARSGGTKQESGSGPADPRGTKALAVMGTVQGSQGSPHPAPGPCPAAVPRLQRGTTVTGRSGCSRVPALAGTGFSPGRCPAGPTQNPGRQQWAAGSGPGRASHARETEQKMVQWLSGAP